VDLLQAITRALLTSEEAKGENTTVADQFPHSLGANCRVQRLLDVHVYKADSNAKAQTLLSVEMKCRRKQLVQIEVHNGKWILKLNFIFSIPVVAGLCS
jgi:hypothetical protein